MLRSLRIKFIILLLAISLIAFSSALIVRELMIKDFRKYIGGEMEDRVYWVMADLEGMYEKFSGWKVDLLAEDAIWAFMLGLETKIRNRNGEVVMDTEKALTSLQPFKKRRVMSFKRFRGADTGEDFTSYPLFLEGRNIGRLDVSFRKPGREEIFIQRSNGFLMGSLLVLGGLSIILSMVFSNRLTKPLQELSRSAKAISEGDIKSRVTVSGSDEISGLAKMFNRMASSLEVQESLRRKMTSNVAHELRTPLTAIMGELEGMMDGHIKVDREHLMSLHEEARRLKRILEACEKLTAAQASSLSLRKKNIELKPLLTRLSERIGKLFRDKGVTLDLICEENMMVCADPDQLSQMVINLLNNSLNATERGGRTWVEVDRKKSELSIKVGDTGRGIKEEDLPYIFERFYSVQKGGLGIGLTIVRELMDAHKGRIEAKSTLGKGSTFTLYFPLEDLHNVS